MNRSLDQQPPTAGAHSTRERKKKGWIVWMILSLVAVAALALWAIADRSNDDDDGAPSDIGVAASSETGNGGTAAGDGTTPLDTVVATVVDGAGATVALPTTAAQPSASVATPTTVPAAATTPSAEAAGAAGAAGPALSSGDQDLVAISNTDVLSDLVGRPASGRAVVQSVVSDEGFWVGSSDVNRVFVHLSAEARGTSGESPFQVAVGQVVQITGTMTTTDGNIPGDVTDEDGLQQLTSHGAFIDASALQVLE